MCRELHAGIAQLGERQTEDLKVAGSNPAGGDTFAACPAASKQQVDAALAQLGERQTEDLKVPGSIPGGGTPFFRT